MFCTHCGHENPAGAKFCGNCGRPLQAVGDLTTGSFRLDEAAEAIESVDAGVEVGDLVAELEPGSALLISVRGPNRGARYLLDRDLVTVGRHPEADIFLDDITVSRRHAEFRREAGRFRVRDAGSLNGTYVNGTRTEDQPLSTGDEVQVGRFKLVALVGE